ncbi:MAPEG family protein [Qipengyuania sp. MTN3-11]|uniref:MAPEG family protein n=1 Tax=Qipengyuania sp. MTN3-11 TaxID=3056557 RepID=UPI0036F25854
MPTELFLPITLTSAAAAALITIWLALRCGQMRLKHNIIHGDDGGGPLTRRMRAQLNFVESAPFVLFLIAAIELSGRGQSWLALVAGVYMLGRVAHAIGMDAEGPHRLRQIGVIVTLVTLLGLAGAATLVAMRVM